MIERLTGANHKELGFHTYIGAKNPYSVALTLGELLLDNTNPKYRPREILNDVFDRLAAYEDSGLSPEEIYRLKAKNEALEADKGIVEASHINTEMNNEHLSEHIEQLEELVKACRSRLPNISHFCTCGKCKTCGKRINYVNYIYCDDCLAKAIDALIGGKQDV